MPEHDKLTWHWDAQQKTLRDGQVGLQRSLKVPVCCRWWFICVPISSLLTVFRCWLSKVYCVFNVKALMGTFNLKKALAWASSVIVKLGEGSFQALMLTWRWARGTRACIRSRGGGCSPAWWSSSGSSWRRTDQSGVSTAASWPITAHLGREGRLLQDHHKVGDVEVSCRHHTDNAASPYCEVLPIMKLLSITWGRMEKNEQNCGEVLK